MNFIASGLSDIGLHREHNEDSFCILPEHHLFIVADGMGGHRAGDVASKMATHSVAEFFRANIGEDSTWPFSFDRDRSFEENRLLTGIQMANRKIFDKSLKHVEVQGMGTTIVSALLVKEQRKIFLAHVGDSRAYRIRNREIKQMTRDHSLINDYLIVMPQLTPEQIEELPKNVITRALGMQDNVVVDIESDDPQPGDRYVLCSDGLSGMITDEEICDIIVASGQDVEAASKHLVDLANTNGGEDNITVVVIMITD